LLPKKSHLFLDPIVKVQLFTIRHRCPIPEEFDQLDLETTFSKFGVLETLLVDKNLAYFRYDSYIACYTAIKVLNQFEVTDSLRLSVDWCDDNDINLISQHYAASCLNDSTVLVRIFS
jgi:hypothetical protein